MRRYIQTASRLRGFEAPTVWSEFTPLAELTGSVNLGQGAPSWPTPDFIKEAMVSAVQADWNEYTRSFGGVTLYSSSKALCALGGEHRPMSEVTVCNGATEGLYAVMMGLVEEETR